MTSSTNAPIDSPSDSALSGEEFFQKHGYYRTTHIQRVPTRLFITEITRMTRGLCVIGLQRQGERIQSLRPVCSLAGWQHFPHQRGDVIEFSLLATPGEPPHVEDRTSIRDFRWTASVSESDLVAYLRKAECADSLGDFFDCAIHENRQGKGAYALPREARRSICGCHTQNLKLELCGNELRAKLVLSSGELLRDLPVKDLDWLGFMHAALAENRGANRAARLQRFLNSQFHSKIMSCPHHFVRIGLTRPYPDVCWLMLDTLLPLPKAAWLEEF